MIVLDTNVLSETLRPSPDPSVLAWLDATGSDTSTTAVTVGEILVGVSLLPAGRRRSELSAAIEALVGAFTARVLAYDAGAAREYALVRSERRAAGHPISVEDAMIAAICRSNGAALATRNTKDFAGLSIPLIDPWEH